MLREGESIGNAVSSKEGSERKENEAAEPPSNKHPASRRFPGGYLADWSRIALFGAGLATVVGVWWFGTGIASPPQTMAQSVQHLDVSPKVPGGRSLHEDASPFQLADLRQALQQAEWLSATYQDLLAQERTRNKELEQKAAVLQADQQPRAQTQARIEELERQLAARQDDQRSLEQERKQRNELEAQLAAAQADHQALAQEQARSKELQQQLAARRSGEELLEQERKQRKELEAQLAAAQADRQALAQEKIRSKELQHQLTAQRSAEELLEQERKQRKGLEAQLAAAQADRQALAQEKTRSKELQQQLTAQRSGEELLEQERARRRELEQQLAGLQAEHKSLEQERARTAKLERQLAMRSQAPPSGSTSQDSAPPVRQAAPTVTRPDDKSPAAPRRLTDHQAAGLMARARQLIAQGDVGAARAVLERAADGGNAAAVFALAETYDPKVLAAWGTVGTRGDRDRAQQLYTQALSAGIPEARDRLNSRE